MGILKTLNVIHRIFLIFLRLMLALSEQKLFEVMFHLNDEPQRSSLPSCLRCNSEGIWVAVE